MRFIKLTLLSVPLFVSGQQQQQLPSNEIEILSVLNLLSQNDSSLINSENVQQAEMVSVSNETKTLEGLGDAWRMIPEQLSQGWASLSSLFGSGRSRSEPVLRQPSTSDMLPWNPVDSVLAKFPSWLTEPAKLGNSNRRILRGQ